MTDPTISYGTPIDGKPFALDFDTDDGPAVLFLTVEQLDALVASGDAARTEHRQATCRHDWVSSVIHGDDLCLVCDLRAVIEDDTVIPLVGEGS